MNTKMGSLTITRLLCVAIGAFLATGAFAQAYPTKPIRLIVPYVAGGATDILARELAQKLQEGLGQPVVVDNKPGAGAVIGTEMVAKAAPDGYTLLLSTQASHAINSALFEKLSYDPLKDFSHVSLLGSIASILVVNTSVPVNSMSELIALAKARPGKLNFSSSGNGLAPHLSGELFKTMAGIDVVHVPYKGGGPAMLAVLAGDASFLFQLLPAALPLIKSGKVKALAVTSPKRSSVLPEMPTVSEAGLPGYELIAWFGISAPAGTPTEIITRLNLEIVKSMKSPDLKDRLLDQGIEVYTNTPAQFSEYIKSEIINWRKVVKMSGAKANF